MGEVARIDHWWNKDGGADKLWERRYVLHCLRSHERLPGPGSRGAAEACMVLV